LSEVARVVGEQPVGFAGDDGQKHRNVGGVAESGGGWSGRHGNVAGSKARGLLLRRSNLRP
jgi:hypothetical protein